MIIYVTKIDVTIKNYEQMHEYYTVDNIFQLREAFMSYQYDDSINNDFHVIEHLLYII